MMSSSRSLLSEPGRKRSASANAPEPVSPLLVPEASSLDGLLAFLTFRKPPECCQKAYPNAKSAGASTSRCQLCWTVSQRRQHDPHRQTEAGTEKEALRTRPSDVHRERTGNHSTASPAGRSAGIYMGPRTDSKSNHGGRMNRRVRVGNQF